MRSLDRVINPEILDSLPPGDARAIRSRMDLRWIDFYLGNSRWILKQIAASASPRILELGAGEGILCRKIHALLPSSKITGLDLVERPHDLPGEIEWVSGDFFHSLPNLKAEICVGSLILHHFSKESLQNLGSLLEAFECLIFCEPLRARIPLFLSKLSAVFMGEVTRHDMPTSIRAGFRPGEIAGLLGLDPSKWNVVESASLRGFIRWTAHRR